MIDLRSVAYAGIIVGLIVTVLYLIVGKAHAQNAPTYTSRPVDWFDRDGNHVRYYRHKPRHIVLERRREVRGWHSQARGYYPSDEDDGQCKGFLAAVGDQYASETGAQQESDKAWMQTARWQFGERFMSRDHARNATYECGRSSVGSVVGQVFYRCRLRARPCSPEATKGDR